MVAFLTLPGFAKATECIGLRLKVMLEGAISPGGGYGGQLQEVLSLRFEGENVPEDAVDAITVYLRSANDFSYVDSTKAWATKNGIAKDFNTGLEEELRFCRAVAGEAYYIEVRHQNHLALMSSMPIPSDAGIFLVDLTNPSEVFGEKEAGTLNNNALFMRLGDLNGDNKVNMADYINMVASQFMYEGYGYHKADLNMDGWVNELDFQLFDESLAGDIVISPVPKG